MPGDVCERDDYASNDYAANGTATLLGDRLLWRNLTSDEFHLSDAVVLSLDYLLATVGNTGRPQNSCGFFRCSKRRSLIWAGSSRA